MNRKLNVFTLEKQAQILLEKAWGKPLEAITQEYGISTQRLIEWEERSFQSLKTDKISYQEAAGLSANPASPKETQSIIKNNLIFVS